MCDLILLIEMDENKPRDEHGYWAESGRSYDGFAGYECVKRWIDNYTSENTRDAYLRNLGYVLKSSSLNPDDLLNLDGEEARLTIIKVSQRLKQSGSGTQARHVLTSLNGFFEANGKSLPLRKIDRIKRTLKRAEIQTILSKEEIYRLVDSCRRLRDKAIILCLFQSGVRVGCLTNWKIRMVKDCLQENVEYPMQLKITTKEDSKLSGYGLPFYYTFIHKEASEALKTYLQERMAKEGKLRDDDFVFKPIKQSYINHIATRKIDEIVKSQAKKIGLDPKGIWTHLIRKSFRKVLYKASIDNDLAESLMGHRLAGSKGNYFDGKDMETLAEMYLTGDWSRGETKSEAVKNLENELGKEREKREDIKKEYDSKIGEMQSEIQSMKFWMNTYKGLAYDEELRKYAKATGQLKKQKTKPTKAIEEMSETELEELSEETEERETKIPTNQNNTKFESKLVTEDEITRYLDEGWDFVATLNGKIAIRKPKIT